jgi:hypothetical protein
MPQTNAMSAASKDSSSVAGKRSAISDETFRALAQAQPEFPLGGIADEAGELHRERLIEPEVGAQLKALLRCRVLPEDVRDRVAHVLEQHEGDERDRQHDEDGLHEAANDEGEHGRCDQSKSHATRQRGNARPAESGRR